MSGKGGEKKKKERKERGWGMGLGE